MKLLRWIFALTYCEYNGSHFVLDCGPIGLSVVGEVAIIYMEDFQLRSKSTDFPELNNWPWYVDDSVLKCKRERSEVILNHLNNIEEGIIKFTKEEEENNKLPVLDLELNVNRKKKTVEFNVHYKKTNTNIMIKKKSNHNENIKRGIIKGYADRARALCDPEYFEKEIENIKEVFEDNGYSKEEITDSIRERIRNEPEDETETEDRGVVVMENIPGFSERFNRIARHHKFRVANKTANRVKDLIRNAKTPLGDRRKDVVYQIPCKCKKYSYTGETFRNWATRKKEHMDKVRLTKEDIESGNLHRANERMNTGDGGLAKHAANCTYGIDWENARIIGNESKWTQRKILEGVESLKEKTKGIQPLNAYNQLPQWQSTIYSFDVK